jgi:AraC-like DNA-binding protein
LMLGYSETSSFTSAFRRLIGVTPSDYRRNAV